MRTIVMTVGRAVASAVCTKAMRERRIVRSPRQVAVATWNVGGGVAGDRLMAYPRPLAGWSRGRFDVFLSPIISAFMRPLLGLRERRKAEEARVGSPAGRTPLPFVHDGLALSFTVATLGALAMKLLR